jgi:ADP-dependent NAD(P)H-hydrate dehydratase / NAD(P)H-hydrate epimerase
MGLELLTSDEMRHADARAIEAGATSLDLMLAAGQAVKQCAVDMCVEPGPVFVLCGPGNNGGDGFVAARLLDEEGYEVRLALVGAADTLNGDAAAVAALWKGPIETFDSERLIECGLIIDALFGAGLTRDVEGPARAAIEAVNRSGIPVLSVDVPSGVDGTSGAVRSLAVRAQRTVTFFRLKPGHLLLPGREHCGAIHLAQIGITNDVILDVAPTAYRNEPDLWQAHVPVPAGADHKYTRGHALIAGGEEMTGAARLSARAALRTGAGLVSLASPSAACPIYSVALEAVIVRRMDHAVDYVSLLDDSRINALLLGPGAETAAATKDMACAALRSERAVVLDAGALTAFADDPSTLFNLIEDRDGRMGVVLTPHEGEFRRLFAELASDAGSKLERARGAARLSGAVVLLKGADTVVAAPDGRAAILANAPPWLATAGSGDVLAGVVTGLLAQGMPAFEAACAAAWMHGEAGREVGPGLISEDLPDALRSVLTRLYRRFGVPGLVDLDDAAPNGRGAF